MRTLKKILPSILFLAAACSAWAIDPASVHDGKGRDRFVAAYLERAETPPFSFVYGGKPSAALLSKWEAKADTKDLTDRTIKTVVYTDPASGLAVKATLTIYKDFPAVEWVVRFRNGGKTDTPIIENVRACDVAFADMGRGPVTLYRARGSAAERSDFGPITEVLGDKADIRFGPTAGRSSDTQALPFFNIAAADHGVVAAVGWSGQWKAGVGRDPSQPLRLDAGMAATRFRLHPGEDVRTPSMALVFWKSGDRLDGHNLFRRFIVAHHMPQTGGKPTPLPISHGVGFGGPFPCNEYVCATESYAIGMIERLHQFGLAPDACWIDAGWYENPTKYWWSGVGGWEVNRANFPRGLRPVTDAARAYGQGFVLWFEPERVYEGTRLDREHPEWLAKIAGNPNRLLNLGDPAALTWLTDHIANFLKTEGITIYRQDFNFDSAPYWKALDTPDRVGIAEMKHIEGLYKFWDALLERDPGLLIDNCASGGRRIDLETTSRSIPLWRTDYQYWEPNGYQCHTYGLHLYVPASGTGNGDPRKYWFRSAAMGAAVVMGWELGGSFNLVQAQEDMAEFRATRDYFYGDYYPLTEYSTSDEAWAAFQWDRPEQRDGLVAAFRRPQAAGSTITVKLKGLEAAGDYELSFEDYGITVAKSGRELAEGLSLKIPEAPGSLVIKYRRLR